MTPERFQEIRLRLNVGGVVDELLDYIDMLHEDLRLAQGDNEGQALRIETLVEQTTAQAAEIAALRRGQGTAPTIPEGARTLPDGSIRLGNRDYLKDALSCRCEFGWQPECPHHGDDAYRERATA